MSHATTRRILSVLELKVYFPVRRTLEDFVARRRKVLKAVDGVTLHLERGEVLALVGESGSGKTTLGRAVLGLVKPTAGKILFEGKDVFNLRGAEIREYRRKVQMVFQDPSISLNPRLRVGEQVKYPLDVNRIGSPEERREKVLETLKAVGLTPPEDFYKRFPHQLSGGQRQRVAIARALVLGPELLIADEPISNIDVSARAQVLTLLRELHDKMGLTMLYITHDLSSAWAIADNVAVMYLGKIVEYGSVEQVFSEPLHPYTRALLSSVPSPTPGKVLERKVRLKGEVPNSIDVPRGCRLHPRCPFTFDKCKGEEPHMLQVGENHYVSCHLYSFEKTH